MDEPVGCVESRRERVEFVGGLDSIGVLQIGGGWPKNGPQGVAVFAPSVARTSAETASSGVAKVLPVSAALVARGRLRASASTRLPSLTIREYLLSPVRREQFL